MKEANVEHWSAGEDKPLVRREESPTRWWLIGIVILAVGLVAAFWLWLEHRPQTPEPPPLASPAPRAEAPVEAKPEPPPPAPSLEPPKPLPTLDQSDAMMRDTV